MNSCYIHLPPVIDVFCIQVSVSLLDSEQYYMSCHAAREYQVPVYDVVEAGIDPKNIL